jgi:hypothetical protein
MKYFIRVVILLCAIALLLILFAPSLVSTQIGKRVLLQAIKNIAGYEVHSEQLKLQWMNSQSIKNLEVISPSGKLLFRADSISSTAPLWKLFFYHDVGHLQVDAPFVAIDPSHQLALKLGLLPKSSLLVERVKASEFELAPLVIQQAGFVGSAAAFPQNRMPHTLPTKILGEISISQGSAQLASPDLETICIKEVELQATLLPKQVKLEASGLTQESTSEGSFKFDLFVHPGAHPIEGSLYLTQFPLRAADQIVSIIYPSLKGVVREVIGESIDAEVKVKDVVYLKAHSNLFSATLETTLQDGALELASPAIFQFQIPPAAFEKLTSLSIQQKVSAQLKMDHLSIPLQQQDSLKIQGTLKCDGIEFKDWTLEPFSLYVESKTQGDWILKMDSPQVQFQSALNIPEQWENLSFKGEAFLPKNTKLDLLAESLQSIDINFQGDLLKGQFKGSFDRFKQTFALEGTTETSTASLLGPVSLQLASDLKSKTAQFSLTSTIGQGPLALSGTFAYPQDLKVKGSCTDVPVASIQPFLHGVPSLEPLVGNLLTTRFQLNLSEKSRLLELNTSSSYLTLQASLKENNKKIELTQPLNFNWTLTPEGYTALSGKRYTVAAPATFKGSISQLSFCWDPILNSLEYEGKITSDALSFGVDGKLSKVSQIQVSLSHPRSSTPHQFQVSALSAPQGKLSCQGDWTPLGTAHIKLLLEQFPSITFDFFAAPFSHFSVSALCGPTLNLSLDTTLQEWTGPCSFDIHSAHLRSSLKGVFNQGTLSLTDKFYLQLDVSKELSQLLFNQTNPLDITSVSSESPITLEIAKEGFSYPLFPTNLSQIQIGSGKLEMGKLLCQNTGNIQATLGLLKLGQYRPGDPLELWFAPLDFQIKNGKLNWDRTEILIARNFQVCSWGSANFPSDSVDGVIGLTASCLSRAFSIKNLPENYVLQIPLRGTLTDVKVDKEKATAKITALLLWQQKDVIGDAIKGPAGKFLGQAMGKLGPLPGGDQKAPPPKKPFPWDLESPSSKKKTSDASHENKALIRPDDSALKQAIKLIKPLKF